MQKKYQALKQLKQFQSNVMQQIINIDKSKSKVLYTFTANNSYAYLLNVEPNNLVFLKIYYSEFDEIITKVMDQTGRPLSNRR